MAEPIGALRAELEANAAQFEADMGRARAAVQTAAAGMMRSFSNLTKGTSAAIASIFTLRNALIAIATGAVAQFIKSSIQYGNEIVKSAQKVGMGTDAFQELSYAAILSGGSQEEFSKALLRMQKVIGLWSEGVTAGGRLLARLGLTMADIKNKTPDEQFKLLVDRAGQLQSPMERNAILLQLFGRSSGFVAIMAQMGAAGLNALGEEAHRLGLIIDQDTLDKSQKASDEFDRLGLAAHASGTRISAAFLPAISEVRRVFTSPDFQQGISTIATDLAGLAEFMVKNGALITKLGAALAAMRLGATIGAAFGGWGSIIGGATGALVGFVAANKALESEATKLADELSSLTAEVDAYQKAVANGAMILGDQSVMEAKIKRIAEIKDRLAQINEEMRKNNELVDIPKITVHPGGQGNADLARRLAEAMAELALKAKSARGEFDALGQGFAEYAHGLKAFGTEAQGTQTEVSKLSPALQKLRARFLEVQGAEMTRSLAGPMADYNRELMFTQQLLAANVISQETYNAKVFELKDKFRQATGIGIDLRGVATGIGGAFSNAFDQAIDGATKLSDVMRQLGKDILKVVTQSLVTKPLGGIISNIIGGALGVPGLGFANFGFASGGSLEVVGSGVRGIDSQLAAFRVTPGESVDIRRPDQRQDGGGGGNVIFNNDFRGAEPAAVASLRSDLESLRRQVVRMPDTVAASRQTRPTRFASSLI